MPAGPRTLAAKATKANPEATKDAGAVGDTWLVAKGFRWEELEPKGLPVPWHPECRGFMTRHDYCVDERSHSPPIEPPAYLIEQRDASRAAEMRAKASLLGTRNVQ